MGVEIPIVVPILDIHRYWLEEYKKIQFKITDLMIQLAYITFKLTQNNILNQ